METATARALPILTEPVIDWSDNASFGAALMAIQEMTVNDLIGDMGKIDRTHRDALCAGPMPRRYDCSICECIGKLPDWENRPAPFWMRDDPDDPLWRVWAYHEVPKLHCRRNDDLHYGWQADVIYERCIETYRAAGWTGEADPANARRTR
jgi:hypothetical protein